MREIKFRAWDSDFQKWVDPDSWVMLSDGSILAVTVKERVGDRVVYDSFPMGDRYTLVKPTGLKDKNGVEIYEGDIVRFAYHYSWGDEEGFRQANETVAYDNGGFFPFCNSDGIAPYEDMRDCEVIGNIYENSELVK